jgi:hypothetical protein
MNKSKKWIINLLITSAVALFACASFNYFIDPLWLFTHSNKFNNKQMVINERLQKSNKIYYSKKNNYDAILIGSSRTSYINQYDFGDIKTFNYSVASLRAHEYNDYINYAKAYNGKSLKYIFIGVDFFTTNKNFEERNEETSLEEIGTPFHRLKTILTFDVLKYSFKNFRNNFIKKIRVYYNRKNVKYRKMPKSINISKIVKKGLKKYRQENYNNYEYNDLKKIYKNVLENNPDSKIVVFVNPISGKLFELMVELNLIDNYIEWLKDLEESFGSYYTFMYKNSITDNFEKNYYDTGHYNSDVGKLIVYKLTGNSKEKIPEDFGILVTKENLESVCNMIENQANIIKENNKEPE